MATQVILLERVDNLGSLGDVVTVKPGYARNYLIPQNKALRATKSNIAYFEDQKAEIQKRNEENKKAAAVEAKKIEDLHVVLIRLASESGQLYGSVTARDIANEITEASKVSVAHGAVTIHEAFKTIGLFDVTIALHPEVKVNVTVNVARSEEEAKTQKETGVALIAGAVQAAEAAAEAAEAEEVAKAAMLEEEALEAEKVKAAENAAEEALEAEKKAKKDAEKQAKAAKKAEEEAEAAEAETEEGAEEAPAAEEEAETQA